MAAELLATYSPAPATTHNVPLGAGRTNGRTILVFCFVTDENMRSAVPSVWKTVHSIELATVDARFFRLLPEDNDGSITTFDATFDQSRAMSAVIWEDDMDDVLTYFNCNNQAPTAADPALWGTRLHDIPLVEEAFACFLGWGAATGPVTLDLASYDGSFTEFADSASTDSPISGDFPSRIWIARKQNVSFSNEGVTATASDDAAAGNVTDGIAGMIGYAVLTNNPPINMVSPYLAGVAQTGEILAVQRGTWRNGPDPNGYSYQWQRSTNGGSSWSNISGQTAGTYTLQIVDEGQLVRCSVTASNAFGSATLATSGFTPTAPATVGDCYVKVGGNWVPVYAKVRVTGDWAGAS